MGRKINPNGFRLAVYRNWTSQWFAHKKDFADCVYHDYLIRKFIREKHGNAMISKILISRLSTQQGPTIHIHAARPGLIIGPKGEEIDKLREKIRQITDTRDASVDVKEVRNPETDANLIAQNIALRIEKRQRVRHVIQSAFQSIARQPLVLGAKIRVKGRLDGADIARKDYRHEGRVPLHTLRADIDYGFAEANTQMGVIGIKVWIFLGENSVRQKTHKHSLADEVATADGVNSTEVKTDDATVDVKDADKKSPLQVTESDQDFFNEEDFDELGEDNASS